MTNASPSKSTSVNLEATASSPSSTKRPRTVFLLLTAMLCITLVNIARIISVEDLIQCEPHVQRQAGPKCVQLHSHHVAPDYYHEETCLSRPQMIMILKELVFTAAHTFDTHNLTYFLDSGTLLGAFRSQSIIRHDTDADFGMDRAALEYLQTHPITLPRQYTISVWNNQFSQHTWRDEAIPVRFIHNESGLYVDIFAYYEWTHPDTGAAEVGPVPSSAWGSCVKCTGELLRVPREWIYPLVNCTLEGISTFKCPYDSAKHLQHMYGDGYMIPHNVAD